MISEQPEPCGKMRFVGRDDRFHPVCVKAYLRIPHGHRCGQQRIWPRETVDARFTDRIVQTDQDAKTSLDNNRMNGLWKDVIA
jgi:hypothetical protein